jgi:membrane-bound ClpP family serine protease
MAMSQHNVLKYMMQKLILSGRLGKWAYSLVDYDLSYESLRAVKGQVMADFIVDHNIDVNDECLVTECPW